MRHSPRHPRQPCLLGNQRTHRGHRWPHPRCQHPLRLPGSTHLPSRPRTARSVWPLASHQPLVPRPGPRPGPPMTTARPDPRVSRSPSRHRPATNLDPRPRNIEPHSAPGSRFNYISYSFYQRIKEGLRPPTLGHPPTPRAATSASLAVPSPSASLAMQSTHALMALLALTSWPAPAIPAAGPPHHPSRPHTAPLRVARREPPAPRPCPRARRPPSHGPRATNLEPRPAAPSRIPHILAVHCQK